MGLQALLTKKDPSAEYTRPAPWVGSACGLTAKNARLEFARPLAGTFGSHASSSRSAWVHDPAMSWLASAP